MNLADTQLLITTLGWSLIHFLWQGTLITLLYWVITRSIQSVHAKYWTGMSLVLVSLIIPILNSYNASYPNSSSSHIELTTQSIQSYQQLNAENLFFYMIDISLPYFVLAWGLTVLFLSFRLIKSWLNLSSIRHECDPHISSQLKQFVKNISIKLDLATIPLLKVSKQVMVPAAYGFFKPTILLPLSLISQIPKEQLEAIIKHELCHLKRNDFIHNIIQLCADILLFFHPGIRWMNNDIRHVREQCCDQMVLAHETEAITYAKALTNIATFTNGMKMNHSVHLGINDGMLLSRVKFLLQNKSSQSSLMIFMPIILLVVLTTLLLQPRMSDNETMLATIDNNLLIPAMKTTNSTQNQWVKRNLSQQNFYPNVKKPINKRLIKSIPNSDISQDKPALMVEPKKHAFNDVINDLNVHLQQSLDQNHLFDTDLDLVASNEVVIPKTNIPEVIDLSALSYQPPENIKASTSSHETQSQVLTLTSFDDKNPIMPVLKKYLPPTYPQHFWYNQIEQDVIATFRLKPNGKAYDIKVNSQKNNYVAFEQEVVKAIKKWKFEPESLNHSTLQRTYQQMFSFAISDVVEKNCELTQTGTRVRKPTPCNK
ncbi:M56 family metallopeptidase [Marinicella litoralis]|uniref:TonB family protein n=1 Tax=Marinicella litoralis TaxID=644220 RepID=A0A4R6XAP9_9GAMM|nr:M56 family metallopeptidase [Marinicella litoralis]TDR16275.1 TonB family protein [Marinicella litoralis]